jgi:hypothetical protein
LEQERDLSRSWAWCNLQHLDIRAPALLFKLGQVGGLAGVTMPACEAVIGLPLHWWPTPDERPATVLYID